MMENELPQLPEVTTTAPSRDLCSPRHSALEPGL